MIIGMNASTKKNNYRYGIIELLIGVSNWLIAELIEPIKSKPNKSNFFLTNLTYRTFNENQTTESLKNLLIQSKIEIIIFFIISQVD